MTKTHRVETVEEYNDEGRLVCKTTTEEDIEEDAQMLTTTTSTYPWASYMTSNTTKASTPSEEYINENIPGQMDMDSWITVTV